MSPVAQLIADVMDEHLRETGVPLTQADIVRRAGKALGKSRMSQLMRDPIKRLPAPDTLLALAEGLRVSPKRVLDAYLLAVGPNPAGRREVPEQVQRALDNIEAGGFDDRTRVLLTRAVLDDWDASQAVDNDRRHAGDGG